MNKVYVVMCGTDYEGEYIWGIFKNAENAEKEKQTLEQSPYYDWVEVEEWEVVE